MDDHEIIPGATPTPEQQQGQVPVAPHYCNPWTGPLKMATTTTPGRRTGRIGRTRRSGG